MKIFFSGAQGGIKRRLSDGIFFIDSRGNGNALGASFFWERYYLEGKEKKSQQTQLVKDIV